VTTNTSTPAPAAGTPVEAAVVIRQKAGYHGSSRVTSAPPEGEDMTHLDGVGPAEAGYHQRP